MNINIGSLNEGKIQAVKEVIEMYDLFSNANVNTLSVSSGVSEQPKSLDETIRGARNRAKNAFQNCDYSFGLESGLFSVPYTRTGFMDVCACAIYDGREFYLGLSPAFEPPREIVRLVIAANMDLNQAAYRTGLTNDTKIGAGCGIISLLTKGRLPRKEIMKPAIITAMIGVENSKK